MKTTKPILMIPSGSYTASIPSTVPDAVRIEIESCPSYPMATDDEDNDYFLPTKFRVHFAACDGSFHRDSTTLQGAADIIRNQIGEADADFGFVSDDGICRCESVVAIVKGTSTHREVGRQWLLSAFPALPAPTDGSRETTILHTNRGEYIRFKLGGPVWVRDEYDRETRKYSLHKFDDVNQFTYRKGDSKCFVGFTF